MSYVIGMNTSSVTTDRQFALGSIGQSSDGKLYKYVTYSEEAAATDGVAGEVAYFVAATGYATNDVTSDVSASDSVGAGVLQAVMSDNEFGWIQIRGTATLTIALTAGADGNALTAVGAGDGTLDVSAAVTDAICAVAGDASAKEILCLFPE